MVDSDLVSVAETVEDELGPLRHFDNPDVFYLLALLDLLTFDAVSTAASLKLVQQTPLILSPITSIF
jgi:hypothetical protein